jgi:BioD-like phosphotransacetylase family protein
MGKPVGLKDRSIHPALAFNESVKNRMKSKEIAFLKPVSIGGTEASLSQLVAVSDVESDIKSEMDKFVGMPNTHQTRMLMELALQNKLDSFGIDKKAKIIGEDYMNIIGVDAVSKEA